MTAVNVWLCNPDAVGRLAVANVLRRSEGVRVVGTSADAPASDGRSYDVVVLDSAVPGQRVRVVSSSPDGEPVEQTLAAPETRSAAAYRQWATEILLTHLGGVVVTECLRDNPSPNRPCDGGRPYVPHSGISLVAIAASTGGPDALEVVLQGIGADFPVPVVIVQHMGGAFTEGFAARLDRRVPLAVVHAEDGMRLLPGRAVLARGGHHLEVRRDESGFRVELTDGELEHGCRPAADVLFRSLDCADGRVLAVVLTGLGEDGGAGADQLRQHGARVLVQDRETSVVWGMPGAVVARGAADEVLPLADIASRITHHTFRTLIHMPGVTGV